MANQQNNRVNNILDDATLQNQQDILAKFKDTMPFLIGLTMEERQALPSVDVSNKAFIEDAFNLAKNNEELIPKYIDIDGLGKDVKLFNQLDDLSLKLQKLIELVEDTKLLAGSEAYSTSLILYRLFESASKAGVGGADTAYDQLSKRFAGQGNFGPKTPTTPTTPDNSTPTPPIV